MRRKVTGPEVVFQRFGKIQEGNIWYFIDRINKKLEQMEVLS